MLVAAMGVACASNAAAQADPLEFLKKYPSTTASVGSPNVIVAVDLANRMLRDAPSDSTCLPTSATPNSCDVSVANTTSSYYDPFPYSKTGAAWEADTGIHGGFNITNVNTATNYRRKYEALVPGASNSFTATTITVTHDGDGSAYTKFEAATRLAILKAALYQAIVENTRVARFDLVRMRQKSPKAAGQGNFKPVTVTDADELTTTEFAAGQWKISRPTVTGDNGSVGQPTTANIAIIHGEDSTANADFLTMLGLDERQDEGNTASTRRLTPAGNDDSSTNKIDAPINNLLVDAHDEAKRLIAINNDPTCRNTIVILIVGGGEGTTGGATNALLATTAATFMNLNNSGRRVPIYVIAIAPPGADRSSLQAIATSSGGQYFEITKQMIDSAFLLQSTVYPSSVTGTLVVPEVVAAMNAAVMHSYAASTDFNAGTASEFPMTAPITGTVDLTNGHDINGHALLNSEVHNTKSGALIPQRGNVLVTTAVTTPTTNGLGGVLRAFRTYIPKSDSTQLSGWQFVSQLSASDPGGPQEKRLWVACVPGPGCATPTGTSVTDSSLRNLYTVTPDGTMVAFTTANVATLAPLMNLNPTDATSVITAVRNLPLGPIMTSTPAIMNPPSLDPPPDASYPKFAEDNKGRRSIVWVGTNWGIFEGIDARLGVEVWGFIPLNLLPKLRTIRDGQPMGNFDYFADSSPKVADVRYSDGSWHSHLVVGEGGGGTFYQSLDVTLADMTSCSGCVSTSDDISALLTYFSTPRVTLNWAFPSYSNFDPTLSAAQHCDPVSGTCDSLAYGDLKATASAVEKSVGQTWSDPAIGEVSSNSGPYSVLVGSGFLPRATEIQANRNSARAGTTIYILDAQTGAVLDSKDVGSDGVNETANNCRASAGGCTNLKNAIQADPVSTGPSSSRFITMAYAGDLDGNLWRFDIILDSSNGNKPKINTTTKIYASGSNQPIFSSMATVNVGGTQQYIFFGTGADTLGPTDKNTVYKYLGVLDTGAGSTAPLSQNLQKTNGNSITVDERVSAFPAVAGDIVFFTSTVYNPSSLCSAPTANLYAFTFIGGPAYDNTGDNVIKTSGNGADTPLVKSIAGSRATAPFIVDQHLAFEIGGKVQLFGDPNAYNNGVGNAGVRLLSWREVR